MKAETKKQVEKLDKLAEKVKDNDLKKEIEKKRELIKNGKPVTK